MGKYFVFLLILILWWATPTNAADEWSKQDITLQATYLTLHTVDWLQTRYIAENENDYYERNPILGKHPSKKEVNLYFLGSGILHTAITHYLPTKYRPYWQGVTIGIKSGVVLYNFSIGIKLAF